MSNYLAIATVTAALQQVLQTAVQNVISGSSVGYSRPNQQDDQKTPIVNIYLYQVTPNTAYRNEELPTRRSDGSLVRRPQAALDLHYIFTFHGSDDQLVPQRLLGAVVTTLQTQPLLSRDDINTAITHNAFLKDSTLPDQVERIKFTPTALSLEEFSKLWSVFFQVEYNLSLAYQASVVLMESDVTPQEAPPVAASNLYVVALRWPRVDRVIALSGADDPIAAGSTLRIIGKQLRGADTVVLIEGAERIPGSITDTEITLPLPPDVHAGVQSLQIAQRMAMGTPPAPHRGVESNVAPFVLHPTIVQATAAPDPKSSAAKRITDITLQLTPKIGVGQRAVVVLSNPAANPPAAYVSLPVVSAAESNQVTIPINGVPPGSYLVRVQIDGAESLLTMQGGVFTKPTVTVT
jgi:Pvc16 N-terminal domain